LCCCVVVLLFCCVVVLLCWCVVVLSCHNYVARCTYLIFLDPPTVHADDNANNNNADGNTL
jgi:hypothetical protein